MGILIDIGLILLIVIFAFVGYKQGLVKSILKILAFLIAIILTIMLYKPVASFIMQNTDIAQRLQTSFVQRVVPEGNSIEKKVEVEQGLPGMIIDSSVKTVNEAGRVLAERIIELGTFILLYIVIRLILKVVIMLTDMITKIPVLKQFNEMRWANIWNHKRSLDDICCLCNNGCIFFVAGRRVNSYN